MKENRIQVRISTVYKRESDNGVFFSLNVADDMSSGFERLPDADLTSFAISEDVWKALETKCKSMKIAFKSAKDKNGNQYFSTAPGIVVLEIELSRALKDSLTVLGTGRNALEALKISGNIKKISTRERRQGNLLDLED